jgi:hypothetical protein
MACLQQRADCVLPRREAPWLDNVVERPILGWSAPLFLKLFHVLAKALLARSPPTFRSWARFFQRRLARRRDRRGGWCWWCRRGWCRGGWNGWRGWTDGCPCPSVERQMVPNANPVRQRHIRARPPRPPHRQRCRRDLLSSVVVSLHHGCVFVLASLCCVQARERGIRVGKVERLTGLQRRVAVLTAERVQESAQ